MRTAAIQHRHVSHFLVRNGLALAGLLLAMYLPDMHAIESRSDWNKFTPYFFAVLLYGWLVFHNRILFERLFEQGKIRKYLCWTLVLVLFGSLNITLSLHYLFDMAWPVPMLIKFYVFTLTGFGIYVAYKQSLVQKKNVSRIDPDLPLRFIVDGTKREIEPDTILYIESLENYVRIFTTTNQLISRMTLKQAASQLPSHFLRINRSCLINLRHVRSQHENELRMPENVHLRIGRTYKHHVYEQLRLFSLSKL